MLRWIVVALLAFLAALLPGCISMAPGYPKEILAFDEELLGTWRVHAPADAKPANAPEKIAQVLVERREAPIENGRLAQVVPAGETKITVPAYRLTPTESGGVEPAASPPVFDAVMLNIDGTTLLAVQLSLKTSGLMEHLGWVLPVHRVFKLQREGNVVRLWSMKYDVVWMPAIELIDPPGDSVQLPEKSGVWLVTDTDRFVKFLKKAVATPDYWVDAKVQIERLP